jgi:transcription elongation factor Elf1
MCGMKMIAVTLLTNCKQTFQCLRCGHEETRRDLA